MKTIDLKKTELALYKALGKTEEQIAANYGITVKEVKESMQAFGLTKSRGTAKAKEYSINLIDDSSSVVLSENTVTNVEMNA